MSSQSLGRDPSKPGCTHASSVGSDVETELPREAGKGERCKRED